MTWEKKNMRQKYEEKDRLLWSPLKGGSSSLTKDRDPAGPQDPLPSEWEASR